MKTGRATLNQRGRRLASTLLLALLFQSVGSSVAQDKAPGLLRAEQLRYAVKWRMLPAGTAELSLSKDPRLPSRWIAVAVAQSVGYVSNLFKVRDRYESMFRNPSMCSLSIHKEIHEGDRHRETKLEFDARLRTARVLERPLSGEEATRTAQFSIPECVYDVLSAVYYVRTRPLVAGQTIEFPLNNGARTLQLRVDVQAEEEVPTEIGTFRAFRLEPDVFGDKLLPGKGRFFVWLSTDSSRLPIQWKVQIEAGTILATITAIEHEEIGP